MRKKIFTLLLAVAASVGTMFAWDYEQVQIGDLYYNLDATNQTAEVTYQLVWNENNYKGLTTANIPASVEYNSVTYSVTSIGNDGAFYDCISLTSMTIPNSVTSIGDWAFSGCTSLTSVTIPNSVTSIGNHAFQRCSSLTSLEIPNSVTSIRDGTFGSCTGLTSVTIPNSVTSIGSSAFSYCTGLTSVTIPNSVTIIGREAFRYCTGLTSVTIGNSVEIIGVTAFNACTNLTSIIVENGNTSFDSRNNCNAIIETATNTLIAGCKNTTIPNSVISIGNYAFAECSSLTSIEIPNSVTSIGNCAFAECSSLTSVTIGNSVTSIGGFAFGGCTGLTSVTIPNSVTSIGSNAFYGCSGLTSVTIPNSVTSIGDYAFHGCTGLTCITSEALTPPTLNNDVFGYVDKSIPLYVPGSSILAYKSADQWKDFTNILSIPCEPQILHDTIETCQGEMKPWIPMTISTNMPGSYDYYDSLKNIMGCDSILHYHVIVHPSYEFLYDTTVYVGDEIRWRNWNLKPEKAGHYQYFDTLRTYFYCDSVFVLNLEVKPRSQKMCSWLVESNDLEMGAVVTSFNNEYYQYGTQITVEASPNSGYKFVKWNDGKKFNPYKFSLLDDKYLLAIFMEEAEEQDTTTVQPSSTSATFTWPFIVGGFSYSLTIYLDVACTIPFCTITFNQYGQLIGITFGNRAPRRSMEQEDGFTYTVSGLDANTEYYFKMETMDEDNKLINTDEGAFRTTNEATGIENQYNTVIEHRKVMINGQIYILRGEKTYTIQGQEVK